MHTPLLIALFAVALRGVAAVDTCFLPPPPLAHAGAAKSLSPLAAHSKAHISIDNFPGSLIAPHATQQQIGAGGNVCYDLYAQGQDMPSELAALWQSTCATTAGPLSAAWCTQSLFQSMGLFGPENMYLFQMASVVVYTYSTWMNMIRSYNLSGIPYQYTYATVLTGAALGYMRNSTASQQYSLPISFRGENFYVGAYCSPSAAPAFTTYTNNESVVTPGYISTAQNIQYFYITNSMRTLVLYSNTGSVDRGPAYLYPTQYVPIHEKVYPIGTVFKLLACDTTVASRAVLYAYDVTETPPLSPSREASLLKTMIAERKVALGSCWTLYCSWYANRQNLNAAYVCSGAKAGHNPIVRVENSTCVLTNRAYYQVRYAVGNDPAAFSSNLCWSVTPTAGLVVLDECMDSPDASQTFYYNGTTRIWSVFAGQDCLYVDTADNSTLKHGDPATVNCTPLSPVSFSPTVYGLQYNIVGVGGTFQFYSVYGEDVPVYDPVVAAAAEAAMTVAERAERAANEAHARQRMLRDHVAADRFTAPALLPHRLMY